MVNINKKKFFLILTLTIIVFFVSFFIFKNIFLKNLDENIKYIEIGGQKLKTEVVDTPEKQELGLSGRKKLKENEGMLFVFKNSGEYSFWMKEMNFPLDIIWIGENFDVVFIKKNISPDTFPETFVSPKDAKYVLESNAGFSEKNNLKEGDLVRFLP